MIYSAKKKPIKPKKLLVYFVFANSASMFVFYKLSYNHLLCNLSFTSTSNFEYKLFTEFGLIFSFCGRGKIKISFESYAYQEQSRG